MSNQWIRRVGLTLTSGGKALDLSQLQIKFNTTQMDAQGGALPSARIRVYNLKDATVRQIQQEYTDVILQAGYINGNYGAIFTGTINMIRVGRLSTIDSYVDILATDGDIGSRYQLANVSLPPGSTPQQFADQVGKNMAKANLQVDTTGLAGANVVYIRGKTAWGLASVALENVATSNYGTYSVVNSVMKFNKLDGYAAGAAVVLNSGTGLIGVPESTVEGIELVCLLNPKLQLGGRIQINNADINQTTVKAAGYPTIGNLPFFAATAADGVYRALVIEHQGDTRGQEWYTNITALSLDGQSGKVSPYGHQGVPAKGSTNPGGIGVDSSVKGPR